MPRHQRNISSRIDQLFSLPHQQISISGPRFFPNDDSFTNSPGDFVTDIDYPSLAYMKNNIYVRPQAHMSIKITKTASKKAVSFSPDMEYCRNTGSFKRLKDQYEKACNNMGMKREGAKTTFKFNDREKVRLRRLLSPNWVRDKLPLNDMTLPNSLLSTNAATYMGPMKTPHLNKDHWLVTPTALIRRHMEPRSSAFNLTEFDPPTTEPMHYELLQLMKSAKGDQSAFSGERRSYAHIPGGKVDLTGDFISRKDKWALAPYRCLAQRFFGTYQWYIGPS